MLETVKNLPLTFFSRPFYEDLVLRKKGYGISYVLCIALFSLLSFSLASFPALQNTTKHIQEGLTHMPETRLKNGKLAIDEKVPYAVEFGTKEVPFRLMIDTDYEAKDTKSILAHMKKEKINILATVDKLIVRKPGQDDQVEINDLSDSQDYIYTRKDFVGFSKALRIYLYPLLAVFAGGFIFVAVLALTFFMTLIIWLFASMLRVPIKLEDGMRIAAAAGVPSGFIAAVAPVGLLLEGVLWAGYGLFALGVAKYARR